MFAAHDPTDSQGSPQEMTHSAVLAAADIVLLGYGHCVSRPVSEVSPPKFEQAWRRQFVEAGRLLRGEESAAPIRHRTSGRCQPSAPLCPGGIAIEFEPAVDTRVSATPFVRSPHNLEKTATHRPRWTQSQRSRNLRASTTCAKRVGLPSACLIRRCDSHTNGKTTVLAVMSPKAKSGLKHSHTIHTIATKAKEPTSENSEQLEPRSRTTRTPSQDA
jgi:hypothetical protein